MKKSNHLLLLTLLVLFSCNSAPKDATENNNVAVKATNIDTASIDAIFNCAYENYIISPEEYEAMKKNFKEEPFKTLLNHNQIPANYWIDACYLKNLEAAITKYNSTSIEKIDNFWFFLGADESRDEKVELFIVPAAGKVPKWIDIDDINSCSPIFSNYDNNYNGVAKPKLARFNKKHRKEGIFNGKKVDNFSKGIRFNLCLLKTLNKLIYDNQAKNLNGIRIYNAAYKETKAPGQINPNQTTITIVFTKLGQGGTIVDDLEVIKKYYDRAKELNLLNTFNRGELCPQNCP